MISALLNFAIVAGWNVYWARDGWPKYWGNYTGSTLKEYKNLRIFYWVYAAWGIYNLIALYLYRYNIYHN